MRKIRNLGELADAAKGAADRAADAIDDAFGFVKKSNLRIAARENALLLDQRLFIISDRRYQALMDLLEQPEQSNEGLRELFLRSAPWDPAHKMTLTEFLAWEEHQTERHEFIGGETFAIVGGTARHNRVILNLASHIGDHLDGTPCQVFAETMKLQIAEGVLYPDVVVTCGNAEAGDEQTVTDPKLIIEVLSPSTGGYDKRDKFILYRTLASLREYVLIDSIKRQVEVFTLADGGSWLLTDQTNSDDLSLFSIDLKLPMELVFKGVSKGVATGMFKVPDNIDTSNPEIAGLFDGGGSDSA